MDSATTHAHLAYDLAQRARNQWFTAYCLNELGNLAHLRGNDTEAVQHYQASYAIRSKFGDPEGIAVVLNHLGEVAFAQKAWAKAQCLYRQSVAIYRSIGDSGGLATALGGLGQATRALGDTDSAHEILYQALDTATTARLAPIALALLVTIADLWWQLDRQERACELLCYTARHPSSDYHTHERARQRLAQHCNGALLPALSQSAAEDDNGEHLQIVALSLLAELSAPLLSDQAKPPPKETDPVVNQPLPDPLTPREVKILHLIADGFTNQQIADELILARGTVKWYAHQIYEKLGVGSRTQAAARGRALGLLHS